jgi:PilZ domain
LRNAPARVGPLNAAPARSRKPAKSVSAPASAEEKERRRTPRYVCDGTAEVLLPYAGLRVAGRISNISIAGCFIEAPSINLERGTQVEVKFVANQLCFRVAGNIISLRPRVGVGIAFLHPHERVLKQIGELIDELAGLE